MFEAEGRVEAITKAAADVDHDGQSKCVFVWGTEDAPRFGVANSRETSDLSRAAKKLDSYFAMRFVISPPRKDRKAD